MSWPPLKERITAMLLPGFLLYGSARSFVFTAIRYYILQHHFPSASNLKTVRDDAFSDFWTKATAPVDPPPPLEGSSALIPPLLSRAHGIVLDIGPGSGSNVGWFSDNANITAIYGPEPVLGLHGPLQARIDEAGLTNKYHKLHCPVDKVEFSAALAKEGAKPVFDTIVCIRVLCSVPNLDQTAHELYSLLRPGGDMIVVEHVRNPWMTNSGSLVGRLLQLLYTALGWKFFLAGCEMNRDTEAALRRAGKWEAVDLKTNFEWSPLPYVAGTLTKAR